MDGEEAAEELATAERARLQPSSLGAGRRALARAALGVTHAAPRADGKTARVMLAGGFAGCISKTITAPLARLTILYQVRPSGTEPGAPAR